jgi:CheY-like chemotaxis protein
VEFPFNKAPVDIDAISGKLKNVTIFFVNDDQQVFEHVSAILCQYKVDFATFGDMTELDARLLTPDTLYKEKTYICLVQEGLYDCKISEALSETSNILFLTFGPKYCVQACKGHYRSLVHVLPSVLMTSMVDYVLDWKKEGPTNLHLKGSNSVANRPITHEGLRILIAEDNVVNQKVLLRILRRLGLENVEVVDDGKKAVNREAAEPFDAILMDMQMPRMDGLEACKLIQSRHGGHRKAKVVFVTAQVSGSFETACLEAGAVGFLAKPCSIRSVEECLQRVGILNR